MSTPSIDLNCDLGEDAASIRAGHDLALLGVVSSANIACGGHAGDEWTMTQTVRCAIEHGVAIGAHPGYADLANFGRVSISMSADEIVAMVAEQIDRLACIASALGACIAHIKPHGALYHDAMHSATIAGAIARASMVVLRAKRGQSASPILVGQAAAPALEVWRSLGATVAVEAFADRCYLPDGRLAPRTLAGALISDVEAAADQAVKIARGELAQITGGSGRIDTICIHGDTPGATGIAVGVRAALEQSGFAIRPVRIA